MTDTLAILQKSHLFRHLATEKLAVILETLEPVSFEPATILFHEGDPGDTFYIMLSGKIEVVKSMGSEVERTIAVRGPGEFIGDTSFFGPDRLRTAAVRVLEPTRALAMSYARFNQILQANPEMAYGMLDTISSRLSNAHNMAIHDLQEKNQQLQQAYDALKAAQAELVAKARLESELRAASTIQRSILPQEVPALPGYTLGCYLNTAREVGGDFYNFIPLDAHRLAVVIADVSDKGMPSALFMAQSHALLFSEIIRGFEPAQVLARVNHHLMRMNAARQFVTVLYGILDSRENTFAYARAGHELPILVDPAAGASLPTFQTGQLLGMLDDPVFDVHTIHIPTGGAILLYTDGLTDSINTLEESLGRTAVMAALPGMLEPHTTAQQLCDRVIQLVAAHQAEASQFDDITLVALRASPL